MPNQTCGCRTYRETRDAAGFVIGTRFYGLCGDTINGKLNQCGDCLQADENNATQWRKAEVVSLKGLRARARGSYHIGQRVEAIERPDIDTGEIDVVIRGTGIGGCNAICPKGMVKFIDEEK